MAEEAEQAFIRTFLTTLSTHKVIYRDDYQQKPANSLKKVPVLPPPVSFQLDVNPLDTIANIKAQLGANPTAPPAEAQRFLLKGKALADTMLLAQYYPKDNDTVTVAVKPGTNWDPTKPREIPSSSPSPDTSTLAAEEPMSSTTLVSPVPQQGQKRGHQRVPSVVLSPSPSGETAEKDILLTLDNTNPTTISVESLSTYGATIAQPDYWHQLYGFLKSQFRHDTDARTAWEDYLCASKGYLTAIQIASIRDKVKIFGMAGT
ncbi:hypothetical protein H0H87_010866 [Tephrocybe sp. NHM501043]|nr:hypothetical protein H0H87_010866 [Tephrocybe sp. NHM501043]